MVDGRCSSVAVVLSFAVVVVSVVAAFVFVALFVTNTV